MNENKPPFFPKYWDVGVIYQNREVSIQKIFNEYLPWENVLRNLWLSAYFLFGAEGYITGEKNEINKMRI